MKYRWVPYFRSMYFCLPSILDVPLVVEKSEKGSVDLDANRMKKAGSILPLIEGWRNVGYYISFNVLYSGLPSILGVVERAHDGGVDAWCCFCLPRLYVCVSHDHRVYHGTVGEWQCGRLSSR